MSVTKRIRYEILNRDHHTCQYCGASAPQVELQIDHVIPKALGGTDEPTNLVTACKDCNSGKTSSSPNAAKVAQVDEKAVVMAKAFRDYLTGYSDQKTKDAEWLDKMESFWWETAEEYGMSRAYLDNDNRTTWIRWRNLGITDQIIKDSIREAMSKYGVAQRNIYRYMCGIVWNIIRTATEQAAASIEQNQKRCGHCESCRNGDPWCSVYGPFDDDEDPYTCNICHDPECLYSIGFHEGEEYGSVEQYQIDAERFRKAMQKERRNSDGN